MATYKCNNQLGCPNQTALWYWRGGLFDWVKREGGERSRNQRRADGEEEEYKRRGGGEEEDKGQS